MMWKMSSRTPGDVLLMGDEVQTGYVDVPNTIWYNAACMLMLFLGERSGNS